MPYRRNAGISIVNRSGVPVEVALSARVGKWKWDSSSMYFHTTYKYEAGVRDIKWDSPGAIEWNFVNIRGKGVYLGNTLAVYNHMDAWYGEGDAKVWVDGDKFPSEFGTVWKIITIPPGRRWYYIKRHLPMRPGQTTKVPPVTIHLRGRATWMECLFAEISGMTWKCLAGKEVQSTLPPPCIGMGRRELAIIKEKKYL
jgi:hypothetical protein